jgi:hypothetical protein
MSIPPTTTAVRMFNEAPKTANCSDICSASSLRKRFKNLGHGDRHANDTHLVGVRTKAKIPYGSTESRCKIGIAKATVFPEPVFAFPIQSLPCQNVQRCGRGTE